MLRQEKGFAAQHPPIGRLEERGIGLSQTAEISLRQHQIEHLEILTTAEIVELVPIIGRHQHIGIRGRPFVGLTVLEEMHPPFQHDAQRQEIGTVVRRLETTIINTADARLHNVEISIAQLAKTSGKIAVVHTPQTPFSLAGG